MNLSLSEAFRPKSFEEVIGQEHLTGEKGFLRKIVEKGQPLSILLWGPPGCGKTTIARLYAKAFDPNFISLTGVTSGVAEIKKLLKEKENYPLFYNKKPLLFLDEIHRLNKAQQDLFLPLIENGNLTLIGATTENPSFAINDALLSRLRVFKLIPLGEENLSKMISCFEEKKKKAPFSPEVKEALIALSKGDGRHLFNLLENLQTAGEEIIDLPTLYSLVQKRPPTYDRHEDQHFNLISALHKSVRGSDPDAALYWFSRMILGGEDPHYLGRRLLRMASEDIGLADPQALSFALSGWQVYERLGSPEGELALAQVVLYLALAPKSNASYMALKKGAKLAEETSHLDPPKTILNAPTKLMKQLGYGKKYQYDHDTEEGFSGQEYFPEGINRPTLYQPVERGFEREMKKRGEYFASLRTKLY